MRLGAAAATVIGMLVFGQAAYAAPITFSPGDILEIRFTLPGPPRQLQYPDNSFSDVDLFVAAISNSSQLFILDPVVSHTAELFNGSESLGTITNTLGGAATGFANLEAGNWES